MSFPLVGNSKIKLSLTNSIKEKRLPHAIIIEGDSGTGRHRLSDFIAAAAVCVGDAAPCGSCSGCHLAATRNHPDIITVSPEEGKKSIAVSQIRTLRAEAFIKPHTANCRVFIIDFADTMNEQSQNALLKVLEEPPSAVVFMLICESKAALLDTIISRCVALSLSTPEKQAAKEYLLDTTDYTADNIDLALDSTQNNIGNALKLLSGEGDTKTVSAAKDFLRFMLERNLWGMLESCAVAEKNRIEADRFFKDLKYQTACRLKERSSSFEAKALSRLYSILCELEKSLASNINLGLLTATLVCRASETV